MNSISTVIFLLLILIITGYLYNKYETKLLMNDTESDNLLIQKYLLGDEENLETSKLPILWIYVPYEYNSRNWINFYSRTSFDLNQPYLYLTLKSIINQCNSSFKICIIDYAAFEKLLPGWKINLERVPNPISDKLVQLGFMNLLKKYGGMICPLSFLCNKDLISLYQGATVNNKMFLCEMINRNVSSTNFDFYPSLKFCGAPKNCKTVCELINYMERIISTDFTSQSIFEGDFDKWCQERIQANEINLVNGLNITTKTIENQPILIEDLLGNTPLKINNNRYGIYIPSNDILNRLNYQWFTRMSAKQVLESDTIIGNYILLANVPSNNIFVKEELKQRPNWVGFWKTPLFDGLYGVKPNFLGDNILKEKYPGYQIS